MKKIIVAGATGYLGTHLIKELLLRSMDFQAIGRNADKLRNQGLSQKQIIEAEVTQPGSLKGTLNGAEVVISTVGITRQKDGLSYMDVDYQANLNLLQEAESAGVKKFIYIAAIGGAQMRELKIMEAKEAFVDVLQSGRIDFTVIRPNGFFSDMRDFLDMARKGRVYLFGDGEFKLNPIHGADLARLIIDSVNVYEHEIEVGGPEIFTQNEIATLALKAWKRKVKISHLPDWTRKLLLKTIKTFTGSKIYGPYEFFLNMIAQDNIAPRYGSHRLQEFFKTEVDKMIKKAND